MKRNLFLILSFIFCYSTVYSQSETFTTGSYIINMGVVPQTVGNGMKPYGMIYDLIKNYKVPVKWIIKAGKLKDSADFTYNGTAYKGGSFVIPKEYINSAVQGRITYWVSQGVIGTYTNSSLTVTVTRTITYVPRWTINDDNLNLSKAFFTQAGIPHNAFDTALPSTLTACNDILVMPHSDPTWATHGDLYNWNRNLGGAIWAGCHAVSEMENSVNPSNTSEQLNFLSTKGLMDDSHDDGSPAYKYYFNRASYNGAPISASASDPVFQMMGSEDAAHTNGSEDIYIPVAGAGSGWRNTTHIGCYDSTHDDVSSFPHGPAAVTLYGRGFGLSTSGYVMYQGGHSIIGNSAAEVSAARQFFNFAFMVMTEKVPIVTTSSVPASMVANGVYAVSVTATSMVGGLTYQWTSTAGGTFSNANAASTTFTAPSSFPGSNIQIACVVTDACGRATFHASSVITPVVLPVHLVSFDAKPVQQTAILIWNTSSEENLDNFEIYRSYDGKEFVKAGQSKAEGKGTAIMNYSFIDRSISGEDLVFYKLKMNDFNGGCTWSNTLFVRINNADVQGNAVITSYPNPASRFLNLELASLGLGDLDIEIFDIYGRSVDRIFVPATNLQNLVTLDVSKLAKGTYVINMTDNQTQVQPIRFIKD